MGGGVRLCGVVGKSLVVGWGRVKAIVGKRLFAFAFWDTEMPGNVKKATAILQCTSTITKAHLQNVIRRGSH